MVSRGDKGTWRESKLQAVVCVGNKIYKKKPKSRRRGVTCLGCQSPGVKAGRQQAGQLLSAMHCQKETEGLLQDTAVDTNPQPVQERFHARGFSLEGTHLSQQVTVQCCAVHIVGCSMDGSSS